MGQENCGTDQTHYCRHCLKHANVLYATARQKTAATLHSQKDFRAPTRNPDRPRILRNRRASTCDPAPNIWDFAPRRTNAVQNLNPLRSLGWDLVDGRLVPNATEQAVIERMKSMRANG